MLKRTVICLTSAMFVFIGAALNSVAAAPSPVARLPIEIIDNRTHIQLQGPHGPVTLLLDTGATTSIFFDRSLVPDQALTGDEAQVNFPAIGHSVVGKRLGSVAFSGDEGELISSNGLLVVGEDEVEQALDANFHGIIGQELFRRYVVEIDPQQGVMTLYPAGTDLEDDFEIEHRLLMQGHTPYIHFKSKMPWEKRTTVKNMLLDSGYPGGMVFWNRKHFMQVTSKTERTRLTANNMGVLTAANVDFGELYFENMPIFIASDVPKQSEDRDGLIGASILAQYRHVIDFQGERLLLSPVVDEEGEPVQIIDGAIYTPNNEDFLVKFFGPKLPIYPSFTIYNVKTRPGASHHLGQSDHN
ncbi:MAG: hypothetical protein JJ850_18215 [Kordiimonadaceae bacterium]|nr:hypothetical protein [Kordiimonadaceae bacterium]MBO6570580.1 hypothetical protein [Kordiimonadaceae bacterium]MBO6966562.1 hypothetical protein [Kordiimonadaceae bacterium]